MNVGADVPVTRKIGWASRDQAWSIGLPLLTIVVGIVLWQVLVVALNVPNYLVPTPVRVWEVGLARISFLASGTIATGREVVLGFVISMLLGTPIGVVLAKSKTFERTAYPIVVAIQIVPKLAFGPLLIVWFGFGLTPKLMLVFLIAFFPIVLNTAIGLRSASEELHDLARSLGFSRLAAFVKIELPQALPAVFGGLKIAVTLAVVGAVVAEFLGAESGLGYIIVVAGGQLDTPLLFAALIVLTVLGLGLYGVLSILERVAIPWAEERKLPA